MLLTALLAVSLTVRVVSAAAAPVAVPQQLGEDAGLQAVQDLLTRLLPRHTTAFSLGLRSCPAPADGSAEHAACFTFRAADGKVHVTGTSGVELAAGVHAYLKEFCGSSISWEATGGNMINTSCLEDGSKLELLAKQGPQTRHRSAPWHYYQNVVTASYSSTWWDWERWQQELDWMALNGVNLPLAFTGQELVWQRVFARFNVSRAELEDFFTGPAFLAWGRMGNIQGYGGPLPQGWIERQAALQHRILARMRAFGMTPVLPAFAGFIPRALAAKRPGAKVLTLPNWGHFPEPYCCVRLLDPLDPLFHEIGQAAVEELRREYGWDAVSFYSADTFNEMLPPSSSPPFLSSLSAAVHSAMAAADANATWLLQAWTFANDPKFWKFPQIQAYIEGVPPGRLVLLDLAAEVLPVWQRTAAFAGAPFIWCMLHNFGGNSEMFGNMRAVAERPFHARAAAPNLVGWGLCPEGIEQNPVMYDLMNEVPFRQKPINNLFSWVKAWAERRYGLPPTPSSSPALMAWFNLQYSVYNVTGRQLDHAKDIPTSRPGLLAEEVGQWGLRPEVWYAQWDVMYAWRDLAKAAAAHPSPPSTLLYDLALSKRATSGWVQVLGCYKTEDAGCLADASKALLELLDDMEQLLSCHEGFLLGPRLEAAKAAAATEAEAALFEKNTRTQLTVWGEGSSGHSELEDYANREWAGLLGGYYTPRWRLWLARLQEDLRLDRPYDAEAWAQESLAHSRFWTAARDTYPTRASGDAVALSQALSKKYSVFGGDTLRVDFRWEGNLVGYW